MELEPPLHRGWFGVLFPNIADGHHFVSFGRFQIRRVELCAVFVDLHAVSPNFSFPSCACRAILIIHLSSFFTPIRPRSVSSQRRGKRVFFVAGPSGAYFAVDPANPEQAMTPGTEFPDKPGGVELAREVRSSPSSIPLHSAQQ